MKSVETFRISRFSETEQETVEAPVARERPLTIILNNQELVTLLCSPDDLKYLAIGFLASEGLIAGHEDIQNVLVDERRGIVRVTTPEDRQQEGELVFKRFITTGCGRGATFYNVADAQEDIRIDSQTVIKVHEVLTLTKAFLRHSEMYRMTGGVHSAALCTPSEMLVCCDDIGRHNAIDKILGRCLLENIPAAGHIMVSTGRISSEMLVKVAKQNIPIVISKSAPTALGVGLAQDVGLTLIGFVRGKHMNVYTHDWRVSIG